MKTIDSSVLEEVKRFFSVFHPTPKIELNTEDPEVAHILIDGGGISIGCLIQEYRKIGGTVKGIGFRLYNSEGEDDGINYGSNFQQVIKAAMQAYAAELFSRIDNEISAESMAADYLSSDDVSIPREDRRLDRVLMTDEELRKEFTSFMESYNKIKNEVSKRDSHRYERWKAGGFVIDTTIVSMYDNLEDVIESIID